MCQGIRSNIAKKPYIFVIFQEGIPTPCPPLDPRMGLCGCTGSFNSSLLAYAIIIKISRISSTNLNYANLRTVREQDKKGFEVDPVSIGVTVGVGLAPSFAQKIS